MLHTALTTAFFICHVFGLHVYMGNGDVRCFYENLVPGSLLKAKFQTAIVIDEMDFNQQVDFNLTALISETFDNDHIALRQQVGPEGETVFTALGNGEHRICLKSAISEPHVMLRVQLAFEISRLQLPDLDITQKAKSARDRIERLVARMETLRNEQRATKAREKAASKLSEFVHSRVLFWSLFQVLVLITSCTIQLRALKCFLQHHP
ncbi:LAME_0D02652g1_1 [Lachancea meyersii CBS 8951]|uniref:LAME_0D02652g1_1 n=1 Tax=Lachancea meyersii CBS 8951 TaxID=1266667 RepID=A0A1G4J7C4_9SACH|nr:LAME_0D02652g1_1 [Lachancea meyersii CBS 8951]